MGVDRGGGGGGGGQGPRTSQSFISKNKNWYEPRTQLIGSEYELPSRSIPSPLELSGSAHACLTVEFYFLSSFFACNRFSYYTF